jgi:VCBS repeat protein
VNQERRSLTHWRIAVPTLLAGCGFLMLPLSDSCPARAGELQWKHLSSKDGDLPSPGTSKQQTASLVLDVNKDGLTDFAIASRSMGASFDWFKRDNRGWTRYPIDRSGLNLEAGGAFSDIDGDGDLDIVMGEDYSGSKVYWWENPYPHYEATVPWTRRVIKDSGARQHHDQIFGDFDGDGRDELVFWNQGAETLFLATIPTDPKSTRPWPLTAIAQIGRAEGLAKADIDGDGRVDLVGGGHWFKHQGGTRFQAEVIDPGPKFSRAAAGQLKAGGRAEVVFVIGDGIGRLKWYEYDQGTWVGHDLLGFDVVHGHSLEVADVDGDGNLDIFCAEMAKWTEAAAEPNHPNPRMWLFLGDGHGGFTKTEVALGIGTHEARLADLDGDGDIDILGKPYNWKTPRLDVWLNLQKSPTRAVP